MTSEAQLGESDVLRNLRKVSEARGLKFYINPPREIVPDFLGDYQPDAMALGPDGGIVIGMLRRGGPESEQQLATVARKVSGQKGWEFQAIYLNSPMDETPPIATPSSEQLQATFREIEALTEAGHPAAGLVAAWAALESLARLASTNSEVRRPEGFSPIRAVQTLAEEGYIENEAADRLREMAKLRNAVVHGDLSVQVPVEQVEYLLQQLRLIVSDVLSVTSGQEA